MVARKKETAEQKLLKMIEASQSEGGTATQQTKKTRKKQDVLSIIRFLNLALLLGIIVVVCLLGLEFKKGMDLVNAPVIFDDSAVSSRRQTNSSSSLELTQKLSYYLSSIKKRNLFLPFEEQVKQTVKVDTVTDLNRKTKNLRLVGISWMDRAETASAMIEDKEKQVTYFLKKGEKVDGVRIETIYADSVEMSYQNEEMILRYDKPQL